MQYSIVHSPLCDYLKLTWYFDDLSNFDRLFFDSGNSTTRCQHSREISRPISSSLAGHVHKNIMPFLFGSDQVTRLTSLTQKSSPYPLLLNWRSDNKALILAKKFSLNIHDSHPWWAHNVPITSAFECIVNFGERNL